MFLQFVLIWFPKKDLTDTFNDCNCFILLFCLPTFLYYYFYILLPAAETTSLEFIQVEKCIVSGISKTSLDGNEAYSLIYINFIQNGVSYLGSGCLTNQYKADSLNPIPPYKIIKMNDTFECGPGIIDYPKGNPFNNTNTTDISHQHKFRVLRAAGGHGGGGGGGHGSGSGGGHGSGSGGGHGNSGSSGRSSSINTRPSNQIHSYDSIYGKRYHPYHFMNDNSTCKQQYTFSQVKLPTWLCSDENINFKDLITPKTCWVHYYNQQTGYAQLNSKRRLNQRELKELSFVTFEYPIYYPKKSFEFIIVFVYFPLILTLNSIFQFTANIIVLKLYKEDNQAETDKLNYQQYSTSRNQNTI
ncbi:hypothetical protein ABPG72_020916 [Tetrahymena utriculariae]